MLVSKLDQNNSDYFTTDQTNNSTQFSKEILRLFHNEHEDTELKEGIKRGILAFLTQNERSYSNQSLKDENLAKAFNNVRLPEGSHYNQEEFFRFVLENVLPNVVKTHSPSFIGHMTAALPKFAHILSSLLTAINQNTVKIETSRILTFLEKQAIGIFHKLFFEKEDAFYKRYVQDSEHILGSVCSGGTLANMHALWMARNHALKSNNSFKGVLEEGIVAALKYYGFENAVVIGSSSTHYSVKKSMDLLGLGTSSFIGVPIKENGKVDLAEFEKTIIESINKKHLIISVIGVAGTTEMGQIDDLEGIATLAQKYSLHFHVDAAWGGPLVFSQKHKGKLKGIEKADTITLDAHKQLYLPVGLGMVLINKPDLCKVAEHSAKYIIRKGSYDLGRWSIEGTRPANSLYLQAGLKIIGKKGYESLIDRGIEMGKYMASKINSSNALRLVYRPELNIIGYQFIPEHLRNKEVYSPQEHEEINDINVAIQRKLKEEGQSFVSRTTIQYGLYEKTYLRAVLANPLTTKEDISHIIKEHIEIGEQISQEIKHRPSNSYKATV